MTPQDQRPQLENQQITQVAGGNVRDQDKIMLILAYLSLLALIPLLTVKDSDFVKFHAKQGLVLTGVFFVLSLVPLVQCFAWIPGLVLAIMGIIKALNGERWRIPLIADLADKF